MNQPYLHQAIELLKQLIATPSFSREENATALIIREFLESHGLEVFRKGNNVWSISKNFDPNRKTILLNSHHDTVKPNGAYTRDPFEPSIADGKLYGLGSNDAGGPLVSLIATFLHYNQSSDLSYNILLATTAEEEISGSGGIESVWNDFPKVDLAIVGEPTLTHMAVAEKGLMVLDCQSVGRPGHAAREEGVNAIYEALQDIEWFRNYRFAHVSPTLGTVKMSVTVVNAGSQHNVVPATCDFVVDVRATDAYTLEEILETVEANVNCKVTPRSVRLKPSGLPPGHVFISAANELGIKQYGSPTTSDQALIPVSSIKMGPGDSARSHTADEFIYLDEIEKGIESYIRLIDKIDQLNA